MRSAEHADATRSLPPGRWTGNNLDWNQVRSDRRTSTEQRSAYPQSRTGTRCDRTGGHPRDQRSDCQQSRAGTSWDRMGGHPESNDSAFDSPGLDQVAGPAEVRSLYHPWIWPDPLPDGSSDRSIHPGPSGQFVTARRSAETTVREVRCHARSHHVCLHSPVNVGSWRH